MTSIVQNKQPEIDQIEEKITSQSNQDKLCILQQLGKNNVDALSSNAAIFTLKKKLEDAEKAIVKKRFCFWWDIETLRAWTCPLGKSILAEAYFSSKGIEFTVTTGYVHYHSMDAVNQRIAKLGSAYHSKLETVLDISRHVTDMIKEYNAYWGKFLGPSFTQIKQKDILEATSDTLINLTSTDNPRQLDHLNIIFEGLEKAKKVQQEASEIDEKINATERKKRPDPIPLGFVIEPGKIHEAVDAAEKMITENKIPIYQRGAMLVRMICIGEKKGVATITDHATKQEIVVGNSLKKRDANTIITIEVEQCFLEETLTKDGDWCKLDQRANEYRSLDCPPKVAQTLIARKEWSLPYLNGIIRSPTMRADGSILESPGYDDASGLYFYSDGEIFPSISENPTKHEALQALEKFNWLLKGFPFDGEASLSVAISAILTALIRRSIPTAPLHGFTAPKMGSGKSLLTEVVSLISTGKGMTAISYANDEAEEKKRLLAVLMEGDPIVCYDNIEHPFGSPTLCAVLTSHEYKDRILGASKNAAVPTNAMFLATGNNLTFIGDITTRVLLCKINPDVERPEEREFDVDLRKYIQENRGDLVKAGLTILRAYHCARYPKQDIKPFGRFDEWSDKVRSTIVWLGLPDPCDSRIDIESADPVREKLVRLLRNWHLEFPTELPITAKQVIKRAMEQDKEELRDVLLEIADRNGKGICPVQLGIALKSYDKRLEGGYVLEKTGLSQGISMWRVRKVKSGM